MDIQVEKEQISSVEYALKVTVPADDVAEKVEEAITTVQKRAQIPGFRPGKVPRNVVISKYGQAITTETVQELLQEAYRVALHKESLHPVVPGKMSDIQFEMGTPLSFTATVEVLPEFEIPELKDITVELLQPKADEDDVMSALDNIRESNGTLLPTEEGAKEDSTVVFDLQEIDGAGLPVIGRSQKDVELDLRRSAGLGEDFASKILGAKAGQTVVVELPMRGEGESTKATRMQLQIKAVKERELPALNDDFARSVNQNVQSLDDLKADIRRFIEARASHRAKDGMYRQLVEAILKKTDFLVPPGLIEDYLERTSKETKHGKPDDNEAAKQEFRDKHRASAIWNLKWYLLRSRIIAREKLDVAALEMDAEIEQLASIEGVPVSEFRTMLKKEHKDHIREDILERKVFKYLEDEVVIVPKAITLAEFEGRTPSRIVTA